MLKTPPHKKHHGFAEVMKSHTELMRLELIDAVKANLNAHGINACVSAGRDCVKIECQNGCVLLLVAGGITLLPRGGRQGDAGQWFPLDVGAGTVLELLDEISLAVEMSR